MAPTRKNASPSSSQARRRRHGPQILFVVFADPATKQQIREIIRELELAVERDEAAQSAPTSLASDSPSEQGSPQSAVEETPANDVSLEPVEPLPANHAPAQVVTPVLPPPLPTEAPVPPATEHVEALDFGEWPVEEGDWDFPFAPMAPLVQTVELPEVETPPAPQLIPLAAMLPTPPPTPIVAMTTLKLPIDQHEFDVWNEDEGALNAFDHANDQNEGWALGPFHNSLGLVGVPDPTTEITPQDDTEGLGLEPLLWE